MEDDVGVRKLLEFIFVKKFEITEEMTAPDSPFPACLLINDFPLKLHRIFRTRQMMVAKKWWKDIEIYICGMLPTYETYIKSIIFVCYNEYFCHQNVFESFLSVCSVVRYFSEETVHKKGVDMSDLNCDISMEFYENVLKKTFLKCGGFQRLVEYIHQHKFLAWNLDMYDHADSSSTSDVETKKKKLDKELNKELNTQKSSKPKKHEVRATTKTIVQNVLSTKSVELPTLPSVNDSNRTVDASGSNDKATTAEEKRTAEADLKFERLEEVNQGSSNLDSKTNRLAKQKEDISRCESVVQAVMKHNQSRTSGLVTSDNSLQKKADGILKHLKDAIESLIDVLDEYDKE